MRVAVDVRICLGKGAGVHTYTRELVLALAALDVDLAMWFAARRAADLAGRLPAGLCALKPKVPLLTAPVPNALLYSSAAMAFWSHWPAGAPTFRCLPPGIDLYHAVYWPLPLDRKVPMVLTIHDLLGLRHPEWMTSQARAELALIRRLAPRAAQVITDSEATRVDALELIGLSPEKVSTVPLGVAASWGEPLSAETVDATRVRYGLTRPYLLSLCTDEPRKNLGRLIDAYDVLCEGAPVDADLVLVGARGWGEDSTTPRLARARRGRVLTQGYVPSDDLPALVAGAACLAYVSLGEGFGLPPLEAMAAGCPVVASNLSSLPEVVGDAAVLVDPYDIEAIADGLRRVLTSEALAADLRRKGRERAAAFTWERTARMTLEVYHRALEEA